jgi:hypothetical protein
MKRVAWLLLAVFCAALLQVQPVLIQQTTCACRCKVPGACGMPCSRIPIPAPLSFAADRATPANAPAKGRESKSEQRLERRFFSVFVESLTELGAIGVSAPSAAPARVPLFKAHCSFLI